MIAYKLRSTRYILAAACVGLMLTLGAAGSASRANPFRFFAGRTEMVSTVKVIGKSPYRSRTIGTGRILADGSLLLVQLVRDEGNAPKERRWIIRQVAPGRYEGTMSEATGPVSIEEVKGRYRFKFRMKGNLSIEQWLTPSSSGNAAKSEMTVRKYGLRVAHSTGVIRNIGAL